MERELLTVYFKQPNNAYSGTKKTLLTRRSFLKSCFPISGKNWSLQEKDNLEGSRAPGSSW
jgi:hypothetical protein